LKKTQRLYNSHHRRDYWRTLCSLRAKNILLVITVVNNLIALCDDYYVAMTSTIHVRYWEMYHILMEQMEYKYRST